MSTYNKHTYKRISEGGVEAAKRDNKKYKQMLYESERELREHDKKGGIPVYTESDLLGLDEGHSLYGYTYRGELRTLTVVGIQQRTKDTAVRVIVEGGKTDESGWLEMAAVTLKDGKLVSEDIHRYVRDEENAWRYRLHELHGMGADRYTLHTSPDHAYAEVLPYAISKLKDTIKQNKRYLKEAEDVLGKERNDDTTT